MSYTDTDLTNQQLIVCDEDDIDGLDLSTIPDGSIIATRDEGGGSGGVTLTTLWTNPNPTSAFSAQTITLNSSDYDYIIVIVLLDPGMDRYFSQFVEKGKTIHLFSAHTSSTGLIYERTLSYVNNITYNSTTGYYNETPRTGESTNPSYLVPVKILGVKL